MYSIDELIDVLAEKAENLDDTELEITEAISEYLMQLKFICSL